MPPATQRHTRWATAASLAAHLALLAIVLLYRPHLTSPIELAAGPMETVIPVYMTPRSHVTRPRKAPSAPAPLSRPAKPTESVLPATPDLPGPEKAESAPPSASSAPAGDGEAAAAAPDVRAALRRGAIDCSLARQAGMSREERDRCNDRLAEGVKTAPFLQAALEPRMRTYYDAVIKAKAPDKPWTPIQARGGHGRFGQEDLRGTDPRASNDHIPAFGCALPFSYGEKKTAKQKKEARKHALPHALWLGPCFIEPPKGPLDPEVDIPVP
jgi:hypothetical protein